MSFWWSTFPFFWDKLTETKHIWVCVWKTCMALSAREIAPAGRTQPGQPDACTDVGGCWVGMFTLLACGTAVCLHVLVCLFCSKTLPCALRSCSSAGKCACTPQGNQTGTAPHVFHWLSTGQEQVFPRYKMMSTEEC